MRGQRILFDQIENYVNHTLYIAFPLTKSQPSWIHVEDCGLICNPVLSMTIIKTSTILEGQWLVVSEHLVKTSAICILTIYSKDIVQFNHMPSSQTERKFQRHDTMTQNLAQLNSNQFCFLQSSLQWTVSHHSYKSPGSDRKDSSKMHEGETLLQKKHKKKKIFL